MFGFVWIDLGWFELVWFELLWVGFDFVCVGLDLFHSVSVRPLLVCAQFVQFTLGLNKSRKQPIVVLLRR